MDPNDRREPLTATTVRRATVTLIALRVGYAYNWFSIGPALPAIGAWFAVGPADWGLLLAAFLVGAGLLQVPAGFLARRYGARSVSLTGVALLALTSVASAFAPSFAVLFALRLGAGVGAALFFSPAIGLVASLYPSGQRGLPVGTFTTAFSGGAALGIIGSSLLVPEVGWRVALGLGGVALGALVLAGLALVPRSAGAPSARRPATGRELPRALSFGGVWAIGFAFIGLEGASFATGQFIVPYGVTVEGWSFGVAGAVGIAYVLPSLFGGPVAGPFAEAHTNHRTQLVVVTVVGGGVLALIPFAGLAGAVAIGIVFSLGYGAAYAVMYILPHFWPEIPADQIPLAIGLLNSVQLAGGALVSYLFGWVVSVRSYAFAWELLGGLVALTLVALVAVPATRGPGAGPRAEAGPVPSGARGP